MTHRAIHAPESSATMTQRAGSAQQLNFAVDVDDLHFHLDGLSVSRRSASRMNSETPSGNSRAISKASARWPILSRVPGRDSANSTRSNPNLSRSAICSVRYSGNPILH
jgi:hypothetical protein